MSSGRRPRSRRSAGRANTNAGSTQTRSPTTSSRNSPTWRSCSTAGASAWNTTNRAAMPLCCPISSKWTQARVKAGGVCLSCKTPYAPKMEKEMGKDYYAKPYKEVQAMIPEQHRSSASPASTAMTTRTCRSGSPGSSRWARPSRRSGSIRRS